MPKLDEELADWWPLMSAPADYEEEAAFYEKAPRLESGMRARAGRHAELGARFLRDLRGRQARQVMERSGESALYSADAMVPVQPPKQFTHGDILRWRKVGGLILAEVQYQPGQRVHRHVHPHARFVLVLSGGITEIRGDDTETHGSSTLLFRQAGEPHAYLVSASGATCLIVDVDEGWQARARVHAPVLEQSAAFRGGFVLHLAHRLHGEFRQRDEVSRLAIESIALGVLAEASRRAAQERDRPAPGWLRQARALVDTHFAKPLPLVEVARRVGVHPVHLARTFRRVHQITFAGYVRHVRIEFARRELAVSGASLGDIAVAAGFCDQSHFSRLFKRYTGQTPAEYRLALQVR